MIYLSSKNGKNTCDKTYQNENDFNFINNNLDHHDGN